jgi:hypothetical protein
MGVPQNGWFILENPVEMDDLGTPTIGTAHLIFHGLLDASVHCGETADGLDSGQVDEGSLSGGFRWRVRGTVMWVCLKMGYTSQRAKIGKIMTDQWS